MTFFDRIPPLIDRALTPDARLILLAMRTAALSFSPVSLQAIERRTGLSKNEVWRSVQAMQNADLVHTPDVVRQVYHLTPAGWNETGGKPFWMEG